MYKSDFLDVLGRHHMYRLFDSALHKAEHDLALKDGKKYNNDLLSYCKYTIIFL